MKDRHEREIDREVKATEVKDRHERETDREAKATEIIKDTQSNVSPPRQNASKIWLRFGYYG